MGCYNQTQTRPAWGQGNFKTIVKGASRSALRMSTLLVCWAGQTLLNHLQLQQGVILAPRNEAHVGLEHISQRCCIPIQAIKTDQDLRKGKGQAGRVTSDHLESAVEFASIIAVACPPKSAHPLMRMSLEKGGPDAHH